MSTTVNSRTGDLPLVPDTQRPSVVPRGNHCHQFLLDASRETARTCLLLSPPAPSVQKYHHRAAASPFYKEPHSVPGVCMRWLPVFSLLQEQCCRVQV